MTAKRFRNLQKGAARPSNSKAHSIRNAETYRHSPILGVVATLRRSIRQASFLQNCTNQAMYRRTCLRRLEYHSVSTCQRHRKRSHAKDHRTIPRCNSNTHADRLPNPHRQIVWDIARNRLACNLTGDGCCFAQDRSSKCSVESSPAFRRPCFGNHELNEFRPSRR